MPIGSEYNLLSTQYVQFIQRVSFQSTGNMTPAIPANSTHGYVSGNIQVPLPTGQALRFARVSGDVFESTNAGVITIQSFYANIRNNSGLSLIVQPYRQAGQGILGNVGQVIQFSDDELIFWNDYLEVGGIGGSLTFGLGGDASNSSAAAVTIGYEFTILVEYFSYTSGPLRLET